MSVAENAEKSFGDSRRVPRDKLPGRRSMHAYDGMVWDGMVWGTVSETRLEMLNYIPFVTSAK